MLKRLATVAACLSVLALSACGNEADGKDTAADPAASETTSESTDASPEESSEASGATTTCDYPEDGQEPARDVDAPDAEAPSEGTASATITTNFGDIGLTLDAATAPCTVQLVRLARRAGVLRRHAVPADR